MQSRRHQTRGRLAAGAAPPRRLRSRRTITGAGTDDIKRRSLQCPCALFVGDSTRSPQRCMRLRKTSLQQSGCMYEENLQLSGCMSGLRGGTSPGKRTVVDRCVHDCRYERRTVKVLVHEPPQRRQVRPDRVRVAAQLHLRRSQRQQRQACAVKKKRTRCHHAAAAGTCSVRNAILLRTTRFSPAVESKRMT